MLARALSLCIVIGSLALAAAGCGGDPSGTTGDTGAKEGAACMGGGDCAADLFCFVKTNNQPGVCTKIPATCGAAAKCSDPCYDAPKKTCTGMGSGCVSVGSSVTLSCL